MTSRLGESDYRAAGPRSPGGLASWPSDAPRLRGNPVDAEPLLRRR